MNLKSGMLHLFAFAIQLAVPAAVGPMRTKIAKVVALTAIRLYPYTYSTARAAERAPTVSNVLSREFCRFTLSQAVATGSKHESGVSKALPEQERGVLSGGAGEASTYPSSHIGQRWAYLAQPGSLDIGRGEDN